MEQEVLSPEDFLIRKIKLKQQAILLMVDEIKRLHAELHALRIRAFLEKRAKHGEAGPEHLELADDLIEALRDLRE